MKIEITAEQANDYMLLIEAKFIDMQKGEEAEVAPATIRRLSRTYDYLAEKVKEQDADN